VAVLKGHSGRVTAVAISADACTVVSGSADKTVRVWRVEGEAATTVHVLQGNTERVRGRVIPRVALAPVSSPLSSHSINTGEPPLERCSHLTSMFLPFPAVLCVMVVSGFVRVRVL
jgi:WD40 repeat protein